ncbi:uncharacterized protein LOC132892255 isoform X1 [Neoarius graeffei]|uniref:uncharacterized protein LOC132892255 isoform X1 n=1 Tax=Neoarius graeffei TaxID=443677 RepID=UPI00298BDA2D|nr:uncharacterized protein LOC132892255 isoform X1 [Neoarius graeffei]
MRAVSEDRSVLSRLSLSNAHASYLSTHGIAPHFKNVFSMKLQTKMFSLNADEATNANMDKMLNVLVRFFDEEMRKVVTQHFGSRIVNIADASSLTNALHDILRSYNLTWDQVTSVLLDNCSVMRGKRSGVETQIRQLNPSLLDISGDTVHMVSNAAKALLGSFQNYVEEFCMDVYDIEKFPKQKELFGELQSLLHMKKKSLIRPISRRFLQMLDVCNRVRELVDPLIAHYYSFLSPNDQHKYRWLLNQVQQKHGVTSDEKARMVVLQQQLVKGQTDANNDRKKRICVLFIEFNKLTTTIDMYRRGILPSFQVFLKKLQHEKPMLHILHLEMVLLVRDVLSKFMKPDTIPLDVDSLLNLDLHNRDLQ